MLNKKNGLVFSILVLLIFCCSISAQTTEWKVVWDKNSEIDTVLYYKLYRNIDSAPSSEQNFITNVDTPSVSSQDSVYYTDLVSSTNIIPGEWYFYRVKAVNRHGESVFSEPADAAIPSIIMENFVFPPNSVVDINLDNSIYVNDPDNLFNELSWVVIGDIAEYNPSNHILTLTTPVDTIYQVNITLTVTDPDGFYDTKVIVVSGSSIDPVPEPDGTKTNPFPNPCRFGSGCEGITFRNLPDNSVIIIYNILREPVFESPKVSNEYFWNVKNNAWKDIQSGLYIFIVKDKNNNKIDAGKILIIR